MLLALLSICIRFRAIYSDAEGAGSQQIQQLTVEQ